MEHDKYKRYQNSQYQVENEIGVSLFEVLIVMTIISILSHLSLSAYQHNVKKQQLIHSVRETIAFLSSQRQQAILFNHKIQIILSLSPHNDITANIQSSLPPAQKQKRFRFVSGVQLIKATTMQFSFGGLRQTLRPMSFVIADSRISAEVKIIISSLGRIRACSQQIKAFSSC
ncbi:prepilin-type N-terminal cleavage/methylation domain-containing protein [Proteus hauseri]|uniref:prepilin-type N-terminal cleavage/methylation domain-containing protein n=1 Tax=Proteus hauseri TaxID=183417 RepID=UPI0032DAD3FC